jgi:hypothetical protein
MRETHKYDNFGGGNLVPITGKSTTIARTFQHLVSLIASLQESQTRCLTEHVDHEKTVMKTPLGGLQELTQT